MAPDGRRGKAASHLVADTLREQILEIGEEGRFLGSEDDLLEGLDVSRPTLRQAARILEHEQLLTVRRGANGGFFSRMPTTEAVARVASVYLRSRATSLDDMTRAAALLAPEIARRAAANPSDEARHAFAAAVRAEPSLEEAGPAAFLHDVVREFGLKLVALVDNPALVLFFTVIMELAMMPFEVSVFAAPGRSEDTRTYHLRLATAVEAGDEVAAVRTARDYYALIEDWPA